MTEVERRYAQIEKEALACTWACEKFADYLLGATFTVETDYKTLIPLISTKLLNNQVLRFQLRMDRFNYNIIHIPGKQLCTANTLSRPPTATAGLVSLAFQNELKRFIGTLVATFPASSERIKVYEKAQQDDNIIYAEL